MKRSLPILLTGLVSAGFTASASDLIPIEGIANGMSADASTVVGVMSQWGDYAYSGFRYDVKTDNLEWLTEGTDCSDGLLKDGQFNAVNDLGMIVGAIHNPDMRLPYNGGGDFFRPGMNVPAISKAPEEQGPAILSAAVWRDGKTYVLGTGAYTINDFADETDGSSACGISQDGKYVFGNILSAWMSVDAYLWEYDKEKDAYEYLPLPRPESALMSSVKATSANGFPAIGSISLDHNYGGVQGGYQTPIIWTSPEDYLVVTLPADEEADGDYANAISANGRYVVLSQSGTHPKLYLYDMETEDLKDIELPVSTFSANGLTVTDEGNIILKVRNNTSWTDKLYYYDLSFDTMVALSEYLTDASGFDFTGDLASARIIATSGDGKHILMQETSGANSSTLIEIDNPKLQVCPAPSVVNLYYTAPGKIEIAFDGITTIPDNCTLKGYKVIFDAQEIKTIEATELGGNYTIDVDAPLGAAHMTIIHTLYSKNGEDLVSGGSEMAQTYVSADTSLINKYDFDDSVIDSNSGNISWLHDTWQSRLNYGIAGKGINWYVDGNDFENRTPALSMFSVQIEPWSCVFESHFMDATDAEDFYLDFRYQLRAINSANQDFSTDWLDVEYTLDGREWIPLERINAGEVTPVFWQTCHVDLGKELAGKIFRLRFNANGIGHGQMQWSIDDIVIDDELLGDTPTGLRYSGDENSIRLSWHNAFGMHDLSYLDNSSILWDYNVGNESRPMIAAIDLTPEMTKPFEGEYISAVSTFLFDDPSIAQTAPTTAEAIVYVDREEVARARFDSEFNTADESIAILSNPVKIEAGKNYRIGVRISNYAKDQAPMYYQAASTTQTGLTDLFSEDDGRTWDYASDFVTTENNPKGLCVWPIRAHISSEPVSEAEHNGAYIFDIFLNGQKINAGSIYEPHSWVTVQAPYVGTYTIQARYKGGYVSPMSEPLEVKQLSAVKQIEFSLNVVAGKGNVVINGEFNRARLIDMAGNVVANTTDSTISGIAAGIYLLQAETANGTETYKINVR